MFRRFSLEIVSGFHAKLKLRMTIPKFICYNASYTTFPNVLDINVFLKLIFSSKYSLDELIFPPYNINWGGGGGGIFRGS